MSAAAGRGGKSKPAKQQRQQPHTNTTNRQQSKGKSTNTAAATTAVISSSPPTTTSSSSAAPVETVVDGNESPSVASTNDAPVAVGVFDAMFSAVSVERGLPMFKAESGSFLVVGVIGRVGVGKSTLASILAQRPSAFTVRTIADQVSARHCTSGVDVSVSPDRVIVLDMQPILCATLATSSSASSAAIELRLLAWMLVVCHVVVVVSGSASFGSYVPSLSSPKTPEVDPSFRGRLTAPLSSPMANLLHPKERKRTDTDTNWRQRSSNDYVTFGTGHAGGTWPALRAALMVRRGMPCVSLLNKLRLPSIELAKHANERCATAVFAFTKLPPRTLEDWRMARHTHGRDVVANAIALSFANTDLLQASRGSGGAADDDERLVYSNDQSAMGLSDTTATRSSQPGASYVMMPRRPRRADDEGWQAYNEAAEVFRTTVLSAPRQQFVYAGLSERQWWLNAAEAWDLLNNSSMAAKEFAKVCNELGQS
jgi:hypothetical protein